MNQPVRSFEDLECWKAARDLRLFVTKEVVPRLPAGEKYRLTDQLLRSARSIRANIAEGYGRFHDLDNSKFCSMARGSCHETLDHLITARDEGLITEQTLLLGRQKFEEVRPLLSGYMSYLQRAGGPERPAHNP